MEQNPFKPGYGYQNPATSSKTPFSNFDFTPAGDLYKPPPVQPNVGQPDAFDKTLYEFLQKNEALNQARENQKRIDDLYRKTVGDAVPREVEIVPPDDFNQLRKPIKNITPPNELEEIIKIREQKLAKQPPPRRPPPNPDVLDIAPPSGTPGAKTGGFKTIPDPKNIPKDIPPPVPVNPKPPPVPKPKTPGLPPAPSPNPIPKPGGLAAGGAFAAGTDLAFRLAAGQPPAQAIAGALGTGVGTVAGNVIGGALGGPLGAFVGGMIGGAIGGSLVDLFFPPPVEAPSEPVAPPLPNTKSGKD